MLVNNIPYQRQKQQPLPVLEDYDVSPVTGFVPYPQPLALLSNAYYLPWEEIMGQLNHLIDSRQLRSRIDKMTLLAVDRLETRPEQQRAYMLLSMMAHSYVWGHGLDVAQSIPEQLAVPWQGISDVLNIPPVLTYAANDLWNWKLKDPQGAYTIENMDTLATMTGSFDETWFDLVSTSVEIEGGAALQPLLEAMHAVREDDLPTVAANLKIALIQLEKVGRQLARMFEKCDPAVFYWKIRKFLAGFENMAAFRLPNGLEFKGVNNNERKHLMGATAGQSSIFPALDLIFGIEHYEKSPAARPSQYQSENKSPNALLLKMKAFMPAPHRAFLDHLAQVANLRTYIITKAKSENEEARGLVSTYDACVHQIKLSRDTHIQIVTRYILTQAKRGPPEGWEDYRVQTPQPSDVSNGQHVVRANGDNEDEQPAIQGTGGSDLMPFLKNNRDETNAAKLQKAKVSK